MISFSDYVVVEDLIPFYDIKHLQDIFKKTMKIESLNIKKNNFIEEDYFELDNKIIDLNFKYPEKIKKLYEAFNQMPEIGRIASMNNIIEYAKCFLDVSGQDLILLEKGFCLIMPSGKTMYIPKIKIENGLYVNMWIPFIRSGKFIINNKIELNLDVGQALLAKSSIMVEIPFSENVGYYIRVIYFDSLCEYKEIYLESLH